MSEEENMSEEERMVKAYRDLGHKVVFHMEYDAYLNYTLEQKIGLENCGDVACEYCWIEIDWKKIKEEYE